MENDFDAQVDKLAGRFGRSVARLLGDVRKLAGEDEAFALRIGEELMRQDANAAVIERARASGAPPSVAIGAVLREVVTRARRQP